MKKVMLMMLTMASLQEMPVNAAQAAYVAGMGAVKAAGPWIPGALKGLAGAAACVYADYQAKQFMTHADNRIASLNDGFQRAVAQTNERVDTGIKTAQGAVEVANNAVYVGAQGVNQVNQAVNGLNQKANQAAGLAQAVLVAAMTSPKLQHMLAAYVHPGMYEALGLQAPAPLKWHEKLWRGVCDLTVKTVNDTAMHIFSQVISNFMISSVNRLVQSPQQQQHAQLQAVSGRAARQVVEDDDMQDEPRKPAQYRAAIRRRR